MNFNIHQKVIFAARSGNLELVKERVSEGGDVNYQDPMHGSALVTAIHNYDDTLVEWLIANGADVNLVNEHGIGPLEVALHSNSKPSIVKQLTWSGAKLNKKSRQYYSQRLEACLING